MGKIARRGTGLAAQSISHTLASPVTNLFNNDNNYHHLLRTFGKQCIRCFRYIVILINNMANEVLPFPLINEETDLKSAGIYPGTHILACNVNMGLTLELPLLSCLSRMASSSVSSGGGLGWKGV